MSFKDIRGCNRRVSKEDQEFYDLKHRAAEYYRANSVPQKIEGVLNQMFLEKPDDIYGYVVRPGISTPLSFVKGKVDFAEM